MSFFSGIKTFLDAAGADIVKVFNFLGSPKAQAVISTGEAVAVAIDPALSGFFTLANSWLSEILKTQALATAANAGSGNSAQKAAIALASITPQVLAFAQSNGLPIPTSTKIEEANTALVTFFNALGAPTSMTMPVNVPVTTGTTVATAPVVGNAAL